MIERLANEQASDAFRAAADLVEREMCHTSSCYLYEGPFTRPFDHRTCVTLRELVKTLRAKAQ